MNTTFRTPHTHSGLVPTWSRLLLRTAVAFIAILLPALVAHKLWGSKVTYGNFAKIEDGMCQEEVERLLGDTAEFEGPPNFLPLPLELRRSSSSAPFVIKGWGWSGGDKTIIVGFEETPAGNRVVGKGVLQKDVSFRQQVEMLLKRMGLT